MISEPLLARLRALKDGEALTLEIRAERGAFMLHASERLRDRVLGVDRRVSRLMVDAAKFDLLGFQVAEMLAALGDANEP